MVEKKTLIVCVAACSILSATGTAMVLTTLQLNGNTSNQPSHLQAVQQRIVSLETQLDALENKQTAQLVVPPTRESHAATATLEKTPKAQTSDSNETADNTISFTEPRRVRQE